MCSASFFFLNAPATTEIYTLSLHDALPISRLGRRGESWKSWGLWRHAVTSLQGERLESARFEDDGLAGDRDRKSTRLNSSHTVISYAVFCLKKKKKKKKKYD